MKQAYEFYRQQLDGIREAGTWKEERIITTPQYSRIDTTTAKHVVNMCANNYLGLSADPQLIEAAKASYDEWGFGLSSVRFICGTQDIHKRLEKRIAGFVGMEDAILYSSCFDANGGLFETLLTAEDAVISDELNHASIIDGIRLCKAKRLRYKNNNMDDLREKLIEAKDCRIRLIATDGVFSMDGYIANLRAICDLAEEFDALVMVDDSHAVGFMGAHGRGTPEHCGVMGRVDILTGTFGKAMGGASGGYTAAKKEIVDLLFRTFAGVGRRGKMYGFKLKTSLCHHPCRNGAVDAARNKYCRLARRAYGHTACALYLISVDERGVVADFNIHGEIGIMYVNRKMRILGEKNSAHFHTNFR